MTSPYTKTRGIVLAATSSGVGKTTVTAALCSALKRVGYTVQPFKTGPESCFLFKELTVNKLQIGRAHV